jgi:hypothetical protein
VREGRRERKGDARKRKDWYQVLKVKKTDRTAESS